mgnify:CR=1 FL=1
MLLKVLIKKEFKLEYLSDFYEIIIGKTKNNIIIKSFPYQLKLSLENLSNLTNIIFKSIDDSFEFIENIFIQKKSYIKKISSDKMNLVITVYDIIKGKEKEIELYLMMNFDSKNDIIKDLVHKYINIEKEIKGLKDDNKKVKEENDKLNQNIVYLKMELNSIKNNQNNEIVKLKNQVMNILNLINQINQKENEINYIKEEINIIRDKINNLPFNLSPIYSNPIYLNNFKTMNESNIKQNIRQTNNPYFDQMYEKSINEFTALFRYSENNINKVISIIFYEDEKVSDLIHRFKEKVPHYNEDTTKFIYNAKNLEFNDTIIEAGLVNNSNIFVVKTKSKAS